MFKRSRQNNLIFFIISQDYYEMPKRSTRANGSIYQIFKSNSSRDVQILYQDKASMDMTLTEVILLTLSCWNEKYQLLTNDLTRDIYTGLLVFID